ncbi:MAG TPA: DNA-directed RNA polymerase [Thermoplasmata archaeon]|nr:DNA-directed RNA polymerase [Thermoplasmata archaeon]
MYQLTKMEGIIAIPPEYLSKNLKEGLSELVRERYEDHLDKEHGFVLLTWDVKPIGSGIIVHGNPSIYQKVSFDALSFKPVLHEVVDGIVCKVAEFGAFCHVGPLDALVHVSQIMDDYVDVNLVNSRIIGKESKKALALGDTLRARIVALSVSELNPDELKIGLTMRQPGLGKHEWIKEERKKKEKEAK